MSEINLALPNACRTKVIGYLSSTPDFFPPTVRLHATVIEVGIRFRKINHGNGKRVRQTGMAWSARNGSRRLHGWGRVVSSYCVQAHLFIAASHIH
jgi:hypothetical protein